MTEIINDCVSGLNHLGNAFSTYAAGAFVQSALLVIVLFGIDLLLRKRVRAVFRYCVWLLVLVKLVLPPTLSLPTGIGYWLGDRLSATSPVSERPADASGFEIAGQHRSGRSEPSGGVALVQPPANAVEPDVPVTPTVLSLTRITWQTVIFLFWVAGVLAFVALLAQRIRFVKGLVAASTPAEGELLSVLDQCRRQIGVQRQVGLRTLHTLPSPAVCGLLSPLVLMPTSLVEKLSPEGLRAALIHELAHIKRSDLWINSVQTFLQVVYFYNPFVWLANAMIRRTCEEAVDETVLVTLGGEAKSYSNTLIDIGEMAFWKADLGLRLVGVAESRKALQWRIKHMLTRPVPKSTRIGALGRITIVLVAAVLLPMAKAEKSNKDASATPQTTGVDAPGNAPVAGESNVFVDPETGIIFRKFKAISGPSDVIPYGFCINLAPNGKFLIDEWLVVPLDGGKPFDLVDMPKAQRGALSPDGRKVVFYADGMWLIEVDPETGRPTGSAKKLRDGYSTYPPVRWSSDSRKIVFLSGEAELGVRLWTLSIENGELSQTIDPLDFGLVSPDGKTVAWSSGHGVTRDNSLFVKSVAGGETRKVSDGGYPVAWSGDSKWLVCSPAYDGGAQYEIRLVRVADGREVKLKTPGCWIRRARRGGRPLFYQTSRKSGPVLLNVLSAAGGHPAHFGPSCNLVVRRVDFPSWTCDARSILVDGKREGGDWGLWVVPIDGKDPQPFALDTPLYSRTAFKILSPDGTRLLLAVREGRGFDLWVVPMSLAQMRSTGPAVKVFEGMVQSYTVGEQSWAFLYAWSPDSSRIAFSHNGDIWVVSADGQNRVLLTETPEQDLWPDWSPDGTMIAFRSGDFSEARPVIRVASASGGEARVIAAMSLDPVTNAWSPDGKELTIVSPDEEAILSFPVSGGEPRTVLRLKDKGIDEVRRLRWSPDGRLLAFQANSGGRDQWLYIYRPDTASLERCDNEYGPWHWSPDSRWISFFSRPSVKARPESILWEMDVEEAAAKLTK